MENLKFGIIENTTLETEYAFGGENYEGNLSQVINENQLIGFINAGQGAFGGENYRDVGLKVQIETSLNDTNMLFNNSKNQTLKHNETVRNTIKKIESLSQASVKDNGDIRVENTGKILYKIKNNAFNTSPVLVSTILIFNITKRENGSLAHLEKNKIYNYLHAKKIA